MAKALLGGLSAILVVAVVVGVVATVTRSGKKAGDNFTVPGEASLATSGKSVKSLCAPTLYKESCEKTLSQATNGTENPKEVFHSVAKVALESVQTAVEQSKSIGEAKASDSMTESAREDCKKLLEDAADDLRGMLEMAGGDIKVLFSRSDDLETWLTGVMTFMDTCVDGFVDEKLKADMHSVLRNATELSSNALAITNSLGGIPTRSCSRTASRSPRTWAAPGRSSRASSSWRAPSPTSSSQRGTCPGTATSPSRRSTTPSTTTAGPAPAPARGSTGPASTSSDGRRPSRSPPGRSSTAPCGSSTPARRTYLVSSSKGRMAWHTSHHI
ncbi:pectin methylesterase1 [Zea mays]|uniref:Pectin methylesterase1 n=1 Tax=Zea mays TaxID=4577 RepID=A0A1D6J7W6_MAIZE|nr:pectin methylesterase1 [Zea mays]